MRRTIRKQDVLTCAAFFFALCVVAPRQATAMENKTLEDLMTAYNGESNAHAKYLSYAKKADEEGYGKVASLFRAAAEAEEIHLKNHAEVIKGMGGTPKADIKLPEVKSTKENLEDALKGETYERLTMYPEFIAQAKQDNNKAAVRTFTYAKFAEAEHAKLYKEALDNLESWKGAKADFYVCPTCGYTVEGKPSFEACPVCATPANDYMLVT
jgi:rubrerythrin